MSIRGNKSLKLMQLVVWCVAVKKKIDQNPPMEKDFNNAIYLFCVINETEFYLV